MFCFDWRLADKLLQLIQLQLVSRMRQRSYADQKLVTEEMIWRAAEKLGDNGLGGLALRADETKPTPKHWTGLGALEKVSASTRQQRQQQRSQDIKISTSAATTCAAVDNSCSVSGTVTTHSEKHKTNVSQLKDLAQKFEFSWKTVALLLVAVVGAWYFWPAFKFMAQMSFAAAVPTLLMTFAWPLTLLAGAWFLVCHVLEWDCMCELFNDLAWWLLSTPSAWPAAILIVFLFGSKRIRLAVILDKTPESEATSVYSIGVAVPGFTKLSKRTDGQAQPPTSGKVAQWSTQQSSSMPPPPRAASSMQT